MPTFKDTEFYKNTFKIDIDHYDFNLLIDCTFKGKIFDPKYEIDFNYQRIKLEWQFETYNEEMKAKKFNI